MRALHLLVLILLTTALSGCDLVGGIIEAGFWLAIIVLAVIVVLIGWLWRKLRGGDRPPETPRFSRTANKGLACRPGAD